MIETTGNDLVVIASNPMELEEGQKALIANVRQKEVEQKQEVERAVAVFIAAEEAGIATADAKKLLKRAENRAIYLNKVAAALEAGYVMVPNFPGETIAIRVKREGPTRKPTETDWKNSANASPEQADIVPVGEGKYVSPTPLQSIETLPPKEPNSSMKRYIATPEEFDDEIALPVSFLKPSVVQRTGMCMSRKIFDEVAVAPGRWNVRGDPMVLGRILQKPRRHAADDTPRTITFLIAWFQDTAAI